MNIEENLLTINPMSRSGVKQSIVKKLVIHYANNSSASTNQIRNYYESLKYQDKLSVSAHYIIGMDGVIVIIIPEDEVAFHSGSKKINKSSIGVECAHLDSTGKFTIDTYNSLIELLAQLSSKYKLNPLKDVIRHYDVTGKNCPKYYVTNTLQFEKLKKDVQSKMINNEKYN